MFTEKLLSPNFFIEMRKPGNCLSLKIKLEITKNCYFHKKYYWSKKDEKSESN